MEGWVRRISQLFRDNPTAPPNPAAVSNATALQNPASECTAALPNPAPPNPAVELVAAAPPNPAANPAAESNATAPPQNRRRPPKKPKGKLSRNKRGGKQKHSSYNHAHAHQACGLGPTAPSQQIKSAIDQATSNPIPHALRSPPKKEVKKKAKQLEKRAEEDKRKIDQLERKEVSHGNTIKKLKDEKTDLLKQLRAERRASNTLIANAMVDARIMMEEAIDLRNQADEMRLQAEEEATRQADQLGSE